MSFPTTLPSYTITAGSETANGAAGGTGLSGLLNAFETDVTALGTKMGTGASTPAANQVLIGTGAGTSAWQGLTSAQLASIVSDETGSGALVFGNSPTIVTPTIASFTNATHSHTNAAGGGTLAASAVPALSLASQTLSNPYKFSAYLNSAQNSINGQTKVLIDAKTFDTNSSFDAATNHRFVAPISGFYFFNAGLAMGAAGTAVWQAILYKNGAQIKTGTITNSNVNFQQSQVSGLISLATNDYIELYVYASAIVALSNGAVNTYLDGFLVSTT